MPEPLLTVTDLDVGYETARGTVVAVKGVSFTVRRGETLGLVGESGSGKSTLTQGMLRILPPPGVVLGGSVVLDGQPVLDLDEEALRRLRWAGVSVVPQSALNAMNPVLTVGQQFVDTLQAHVSIAATAARDRARELLAMVGIDPVHVDSYAHQLSGGMRQRVALALAMALDPPLVVMDEPTTALDVVVEREILQRILELQRERGFAMIFITHDVSLLLEIATHVGVLYAGRMVELGPVEAFRAGGRHPYTRGLLAAIPPAVDEDREPVSIPGAPPNVSRLPPGCPFHPRCPLAEPRCAEQEPAPRALGPGHEAACHLL